MRKQIITIAGSLGSGKSSTARAVASALGFRHFSSGDLFRQLAAERDESIEAMNISAEAQRDIDLKVDNLLREMYRTDERLVIDSRMAWHWIDEVRKSIDRRFASEQKRYAALYGVNATDPLNFDVVINTKHNDLKTVTEIVSSTYRAWQMDGKDLY